MPIEHTARWREWLRNVTAAKRTGVSQQAVTGQDFEETMRATVKVADLAGMQTPQARWEAYNLVATPGNYATVELDCYASTYVDEIWCHTDDDPAFPGSEAFRMMFRPLDQGYGPGLPFNTVSATCVPNPDHLDHTQPTMPHKVRNLCLAYAFGAQLPASLGVTFFSPAGPIASAAQVPNWQGGRWYFNPPIYCPPNTCMQLIQNAVDRPFMLVGFAWRELPTP